MCWCCKHTWSVDSVISYGAVIYAKCVYGERLSYAWTWACATAAVLPFNAKFSFWFAFPFLFIFKFLLFILSRIAHFVVYSYNCGVLKWNWIAVVVGVAWKKYSFFKTRRVRILCEKCNLPHILFTAHTIYDIYLSTRLVGEA